MSCVAGLSEMTVRGKCRKQCADVVGTSADRRHWHSQYMVPGWDTWHHAPHSPHQLAGQGGAPGLQPQPGRG